jgi:hypothetical protein
MPEMKDKMSAKLSLKSGFAGNHLRVAMKNALSACEVDEANKNSEFGPWFDDLMMHVPVAVVMSAAALEANVNEIIGRCIDNSSAFSESQVALIRDLKKDKSGSIMPKYRQLALLLGKIPDTGSAAWANAVLLAQARNRFIHFSPAWDHETDIHDGEFVNQLVAPTHPLPDPVRFSPDEMAWVLSVDNNLFNEMGPLDELHSSTVAIFDLYNTKRGQLLDRLGAEMKGMVGTTTMTNEHRLWFEPRAAELNQLVDVMIQRSQRDTKEAWTAFDKLTAVVSKEFDMNLRFEKKPDAF